MKQFFKYFSVALGVVTFIAACSKVDQLPHYANGNAVELKSSATTLTPTVADADNVVVSFSWNNPHYATDTANYKYVLEIDSAGRNFSQAYSKIVLAKNTATLTGRELNAIVIGYGFTLGTPYDLEARIISSYANNNEKLTSNTVRLSVTPFNDPSILTSTVSSVTLSLANSTLDAGTFNWTASFPGYTGNITYSLEYDLAGAGFATPFAIPVGVGLLTKTLTQDAMNQTAANSGIVPGATGTVEYRVKAVTAQGAVSYSNAVNIEIASYISILRYYMPGSYQTATGNGTDWTPADAPEFIRDQRTGLLNNQYYMYIYLPAGAQFKITQGRSWTTNYGDGGGGTLSSGGGNFSVGAAGYYRITFDVNSMEYDIREGRMGFVGGASGAGWNPDQVFPNYAMGLGGTNLFVGLTDFGTGGWKMIDNDSWNSNNGSVTDSRSFGSAGPSGSALILNGANMPDIASSGRYRVIWDGRNPDQQTYLMNDGTEMRVVGDGITGVAAWDPGTSPQMTYAGNNVWTITLALEANKDIKFLAGNAWGAFDYEDNSGQSQATGTNKKIKWEGGDNFKTPSTAGTYTITLDEGHQTVRID